MKNTGGQRRQSVKEINKTRSHVIEPHAITRATLSAQSMAHSVKEADGADWVSDVSDPLRAAEGHKKAETPNSPAQKGREVGIT